MMAATHVVTGVVTALGAALVSKASLPEAGILLAGGLLGCLLPDIDHPQSWLGRRLPFLSLPIAALFGHRGITHSLIAVVAVLLSLLAAVSNLLDDEHVRASLLALGIALGYGSHLLGDWLTPSGIPLLWPHRQRFRSPLTFRTSGTFENVLRVGLWLLALYLAAALLQWVEPVQGKVQQAVLYLLQVVRKTGS